MFNINSRFVSRAITSLNPDAVFTIEDTPDGCEIVSFDGDRPTDDQILAKASELHAVWEGNQYQRDRVYPQIGEQLDMLYHAIDADAGLQTQFADFYAAIKAVKDANPKPTE